MYEEDCGVNTLCILVEKLFNNIHILKWGIRQNDHGRNCSSVPSDSHVGRKGMMQWVHIRSLHNALEPLWNLLRSKLQHCKKYAWLYAVFYCKYAQIQLFPTIFEISIFILIHVDIFNILFRFILIHSHSEPPNVSLLQGLTFWCDPMILMLLFTCQSQ